MAKLASKPLWDEQQFPRDVRRKLDLQRTLMGTLEERDKVARNAGRLVGRIWAYPVADGAAYYLITKEKPLTLRWINYMDCWTVPYYVIRGLRAVDIL